MNTYEIWCNLAPGAKDMELVAALRGYLGHFRQQGLVQSYRIRRRKFGFGPATLGEFCISIEFRNLADMDLVFGQAAQRAGEVEKLHMEVYSRVKDFQSALYRDFPDEGRAQ